MEIRLNNTQDMASENCTKEVEGEAEAEEQEEREVCPICCDEIDDATETSEGQEALFCEGTCQKWLHRWCAGVHKDSYASLALSGKPFLCPSCCLTEHSS